ncbi:hypothetical protein IG631_01662 [Alternaria alternata]|nr:hypothetical protein IG631_01662 [Alternaria alternata]
MGLLHLPYLNQANVSIQGQVFVHLGVARISLIGPRPERQPWYMPNVWPSIPNLATTFKCVSGALTNIYTKTQKLVQKKCGIATSTCGTLPPPYPNLTLRLLNVRTIFTINPANPCALNTKHLISIMSD